MSDMGGPQLIPYSDIISFAERVLSLPSDMIGFFTTAIEVIDEAVMNDQYQARKSKSKSR